MMKMRLRLRKNIAAFLVCVFLLSLTGCGSGNAKAPGISMKEGSTQFATSDPTQQASTEKPTEEEPEYEYAEGENEEFQKFLKEYRDDVVTQDSTNFNSMIYDEEKFGLEKPEATLGDADYSEAGIEKAKKELEENTNKLLKFENEPLNEDERFTYRCLKDEFERDKIFIDNIYLYDPFSPGGGNQEALPSALIDYRFDNKEDIDDYIELMRQTRKYFNDLISFEKTKSEKGFFMSDSNADRVIEQCDTFMKDKDDHFVLESFDLKIDEVDFLTDDEVAEYKKLNKEVFLDSVIGAYQDLKDAFTELKGTGKNDKGICYFEGGKEYYEKYIFPTRSGSDKTVEEEALALETRMDDIMMEIASLYYSYGEDYNEFEEKRTEKTLFSVYEGMSAEDILDMLQKDYSDDYPVGNESIPFKVDYMGEKRGKISETTAAYYNLCPIDNPEYNHICVNSTNNDNDEMILTLSHEGFPGHMLQTTYFRKSNPNPARSVAFNLGYIEGWAVYASYDTLDKVDFMGKEENAALYAKGSRLYTEYVYLIEGRMDIGVNYEGWSKEDVNKYMEEKGLVPNEDTDPIGVYASDPGVLLSYSAGYLEMLEQRQKAEAELGDKFDAKEFNKAVLDVGPCQYKFLSEKIDEYIEENK